ncbi:FtsX-like permease family protein [Sphingomonas sp. 1P08PE]|uniref:ABC transporter permease n=1 Tax=Sphingomonas sp. 1P08PE TaxID=554122 RepID=UPI0039A16B4F
MNRIALTAFWRSLVRHRLYAAINIGGLAIGIAVFLVLTIYVRFESGYEKWLPGWQNIYLVQSSGGERPLDNNTPVALWSAVSRDRPELVGTRVWDRTGTVIKDGIGLSEQIAFVDADFPKLFALPVVAGDLTNAFADPSNIVLTQDTATKYFETRDPLGRTMTVNVGGTARTFRVAAVVAKLPHDTDLGFGMLARLTIGNDPKAPGYRDEHEWSSFSPQTFVRITDPAGVPRVARDIQEVSDRHSASETPSSPGATIRTALQPLADGHLDEPGAKLALTTIGIVGVLTLLIAIVNYVNLATARAGLRAREVAMRKVLGADRATLLRHYLVESVATTAIAAVIGLALAELAMPVVNAASGLTLDIAYFGWNGVLLPLVAVILVVGIAAGIYPALVLSRIPAASVLAAARSPGGGRAGTRVREGLVVAQFAIAIAFVIGTFVLTAQTRHLRQADVGYARDGLMLVMSLQYGALSDGQRNTLMHRFAQLPGVSSSAVANNVPGPGSFKALTNIAVPGMPGEGPNLRYFQTMPGFFKTMQARMIAGRLFDASRQADVNTNYAAQFTSGFTGPYRPHNIVINRTALSALRIPSPEAAIGRTFVTPDSPTRTIIGVIEDMRFDDAREPIPPSYYEFVTEYPQSPSAILRFSGDPLALRSAVQAVWREEAPAVPFEARTALQNMERMYRTDDRSARLFTIGAVLAVVIGCVGLWGLASFNTARRVKEVGIRKTLGASSGDIVRLLVGQFLRPVLLANLVAWPLAYLAMRTWLAGFDDRIALSPLYFVGATVLATVIAVGTVIAQSIRASRATPAWALRHE